MRHFVSVSVIKADRVNEARLCFARCLHLPEDVCLMGKSQGFVVQNELLTIEYHYIIIQIYPGQIYPHDLY